MPVRGTATIRDATREVVSLQEEWGPKPVTEAASRAQGEAAAPPHRLSDDEILGLALRARNGAKFRRLFDGDRSLYRKEAGTDGDSLYASASEARMALLRQLAFWCRKDGRQMDRLFRRSGLLTSKWDRQDGNGTYGEKQIAHAIAATTETYRPGNNGTSRQSAPEEAWTDDGYRLPSGFEELPDGLYLQRAHGPELVLPGRIRVAVVHTDYVTGQQQLEVTFSQGGAPARAVAPAADLATTRGLIANLAQYGIPVHEANARQMTRFLLEFVQLNRGRLADVRSVGSYGVHGEVVVGPGWSINGEVRNRHDARVRQGVDADAYRKAVRLLLKAEAWPALLALGFAAMALFVERLGFPRNPVIAAVGPSNSGKTTVMQFAVALFGDPTRPPFAVPATRSTLAGFVAALRDLGGMVALMDESQNMAQAAFENAIYLFANQSAYVKSSRHGKVRGGEELHGVLFLAGEAAPQLLRQGSKNRLLVLDSSIHPLLGGVALGR